MVKALLRISLASIFYSILCMGWLYTSTKMNQPLLVGGDHAFYLKAARTLDFEDIPAPYAHRILTPTLAYYFEKFNLGYYPTNTIYEQTSHTYGLDSGAARYFYALVNVNFFALILGMVFLSMSLSAYRELLPDIQKGSSIIFVPLALILSLPTLTHGAGLIEGFSLCFVSFLLLCYNLKLKVLFFLAAVLSVFQRELVVIVLLVYILANYSRGALFYIYACLVSLGTFILFRKIFHVNGHEEFLQISTYLTSIRAIDFSAPQFRQIILMNNIPLLCLLIVIFFTRKNLTSLYTMRGSLLSFAALFAFSLLSGIENSTSRIANLATPLLIYDVYLWVMSTSGGGGRPRYG